MVYRRPAQHFFIYKADLHFMNEREYNKSPDYQEHHSTTYGAVQSLRNFKDGRLLSATDPCIVVDHS
jgi:hypothetical protein